MKRREKMGRGGGRDSEREERREGGQRKREGGEQGIDPAVPGDELTGSC